MPRPIGRGMTNIESYFHPTTRLQWGRGRSAAEWAFLIPFCYEITLLQWGRGRSAAEWTRAGTGCTAEDGFNGAAADRPRNEAVATCYEPRPLLQWGRGRSAAEWRRSRSSHPWTGGLQWGRGRSAAEWQMPILGVRRQMAASMGPRPIGRGMGQSQADPLQRRASMGPRPIGRGMTAASIVPA